MASDCWCACAANCGDRTSGTQIWMGRSPCSRSRWRWARTRMAVGDEDCRRAMNTMLHVTMTNTAICRESAHRSLAVLDIATGKGPATIPVGLRLLGVRAAEGSRRWIRFRNAHDRELIQRARSARPIIASGDNPSGGAVNIDAERIRQFVRLAASLQNGDLPAPSRESG